MAVKILFHFIILTCLFSGCTQRNANDNKKNETHLDSTSSEKNDTVYKYVESFKGTLKCQDCPGIITEITFINDNLTYHEMNTFIGKNVINKLTGSYTTDRGYKSDDDATVYVLDDDKRGHERWFLKYDENTLLQLDQKEEIIDTTIFYKIFRIK